MRRSATLIVTGVILAAAASSAMAAVLHVDLNSVEPSPPYANWATAARNIQDAVDAAVAGDEIVVTNGVYQTGGRDVDEAMTNRVAVTKPVIVRSVNGPTVTIIKGNKVPGTITGDSAIRCVYLTNGATLVGFTLTNGATHTFGGLTDVHGGGIWCASATAFVSNCVLTGNQSASHGGGAYGGTLSDCTLAANQAGGAGGAVSSTLNNCTVIGNSGQTATYQCTLSNCTLTQNSGRGADVCTLNNCTLTANLGGGAEFCALTNCTLVSNSAGFGGGALNSTLFECRLTNNIANGAPPFGNGGGGAADCTLINCIVASNTTTTLGGGVFRGTLINCTLTGNRAPGCGGAIYASLSNCTLVGNQSGTDGGGAFGCTLITCTLTSNLATNYGGGACQSSLSNCLLTANTAMSSGGGAYASTLTNCTLLGNSASITGGGASESGLYTCWIASNSTPVFGGGTFGGFLYNCTLFSNLAGGGGGSFQGTLNNCLLTGNQASQYGGGSWLGVLNNCTLTGNSASDVGGAFRGGLNNCIVYFNAGTNHAMASLNNCCTTPLPATGSRNFTSAPLFVDAPGGDWRLQSTSPCINSGRNINAPVGPDMDGQPRIAGGTVDVGAFEFQTPSSLLSYAWLQQYGLPTDGSADFTDPDADGLNNWEEWRCLTDPTNAFSVLRLTSISSNNARVTVCWQSVFGVTYVVERATNLTQPMSFTPVVTNFAGRPGTTCYIDRNTAGAPTHFYRVGVEE